MLNKYTNHTHLKTNHIYKKLKTQYTIQITPYHLTKLIMIFDPNTIKK